MDMSYMTKLPPKESGLDTRLYVPDFPSTRIVAFQHDKDICDPKYWCPMDFEGNVMDEEEQCDIKLSQLELIRISNFVRSNVYALNVLCSVLDFSMSDFLSVIIPGGDVASEEIKQKQKEAVDEILIGILRMG